MDLLKGNIKSTYFKYLTAAFGSAIISSVYGLVDMAIVGQYQGPSGTAALAVVAPFWNIIYSLGLLTGIGGSVLFSNAKGSHKESKENEYFTTALILTIILALISWLIIILFENQMLILFGGEKTLLPYAKEYLIPIKFTIPLFLVNQMLAAFLRNDNNPGLATAAVLFGGIFNIVGDYLFVFTFDLGIYGAGLATSIGAVITFIVMFSHFFTSRNSLKIIHPRQLLAKSRLIIIVGFSSFFIDVTMGILTVLFNRQITNHLGTDALSVYGVIVNISTIVQCCAYSVGQAAQPIISTNFGAHKWTRIKETLKYAQYTAYFFSFIWTILVFAFPNAFICIFMTPNETIFKIAPFIMRSYSISFLLLPINIFSTYYFQSIMKPKASFFISISRGLIISGILIYSLPSLINANAIWFAMPITEIIVAIFVISLISKYTNTMTRS